MDWRERTRVALWPRRSWSRSVSYLAKRVLRLTASPHAVAAGVAAGVFSSITPFIGFHFIIAFVVAYVIAGNLVAAATGTFFGNPVTFPFIWASTYATGKFIMNGFSRLPPSNAGIEKLNQFGGADFWSVGISGIFDRFVSIWEPIILPMAIGSVPVGILVGVIAYVVTRWAAVTFRRARTRRLAAKARQRAQAAGEQAEEMAAEEVEGDAGDPAGTGQSGEAAAIAGTGAAAVADQAAEASAGGLEQGEDDKDAAAADPQREPEPQPQARSRTKRRDKSVGRAISGKGEEKSPARESAPPAAAAEAKSSSDEAANEGAGEAGDAIVSEADNDTHAAARPASPGEGSDREPADAADSDR